MILIERLAERKFDDYTNWCINCHSKRSIFKMVFVPDTGYTRSEYICEDCLRKLSQDIVTMIGEEKVKVKLDVGADSPWRAHLTDAGLDLYSPVSMKVPANGSAIIDTGIHIEIPHGYAGFLKSKSGLNVKHGLISEGVVDEGYTGSVVVKLYNLSDEDYQIMAGDKISQLVLVKIGLQTVKIVDELAESERGDGGFGSTGRR